MADAVSPLAPKSYPQMPSLDEVRLSTAEAGIKYAGRTDVLLVQLPADTAVAGVFTTSRCASAPVDWCKDIVGRGKARALLVNSGNANAFTGVRGRTAVERSAEIVAGELGIDPKDVFLASTGVIGEPLDGEKFSAVVGGLAKAGTEDGWQAAAAAIMTTDTYPKISTRTIEIGGVPVTINGIAKGAGMIAPDMATMLSFIFTDAPLPAPVLQSLLSKETGSSFNSITVDSDTSTSDTVLFFATGTAASRGAPTINDPADPALDAFRSAFGDVMLDLAHQIVKDGEGARKFVEVQVKGADSDASAHKVALSIANSPLVKTAVAGEDANWGRVVMAVGKAGEPADRDRLAIWFGGIRVAVNGERDPDYSEEATSAVMREDHIVVTADLGIGEGAATVWTCDLTKEYVAINGDYRS